MDKRKTTRSCLPLQLILFVFFFSTGNLLALPSNSPLALWVSVLFCVYVCLFLCVIAAWAYWVPVTTMVKSDWHQQWLHSLWPRFQAPGPRGTGDSKQATVGCLLWGYTTACVPLFFLWPIWGEDSRGDWGWERVWEEKDLEWVWVKGVCLCDHAVRLTSRRLCKWCCGPRGPMAAPSPEPICSTSIWTLFSSRMPLVLARFWRCCRNATRPESTN